MSALEDMEVFKNCLELTTTENGHLLRYVSEVDPMKAASKGGYFVGRVDVPFQGEQLFMTIDIVPSVDLVEKITEAFPKEKFPQHPPETVMALGMTHPNLIHHFRFDDHSKNRAYNKEPKIFNHSWKLEYIIDQNQKIRIRNKECILDADRPDVPTDSDKEDAIVGTLQKDEKGFFISLTDNKGNNKFCLAPLKAKQSADPEKEPTIEGVLSDRLSNETKQVRDVIKHFYTNRKKEKNAKNISIFRLRVQFRTEKGTFLAEGISGGDIKDTRSTKTGAMDIYGVTNKKSCYTGGRKITITSIWDLDKESVKPRLQVYDAKGKLLQDMTEELLSQPSSSDIQTRHIDFLSPSQNADKIKKILYEMVGTELRRTGNKIKLLLKRTGSDGFESEKKIVFQYIPCHNNCDYCKRDVDGEAGCVEEGEKLQNGDKLEKGKGKACPGNPLRRMGADSGLRNASTSGSPSFFGFPIQNENNQQMEICDSQISTGSDSGMSAASGSWSYNYNSASNSKISDSGLKNENNQPMEISTGSDSGVGVASGSWSYDYNSASTSKIIQTVQFDNNNLYQPLLSSSIFSDFQEDIATAVTAPFITNEFLNSLPGPSQREELVNVSAWSSNNEMDDLTREELGYDPVILVGDVGMGSTDARFKTDGLGPRTRKIMKKDVGSPIILRKFKTEGFKREIKEEDVEDPLIPRDEIKQEIIKDELEDTCSEYEEDDSNDRHNVSLLAHWLKLCSIKIN